MGYERLVRPTSSPAFISPLLSRLFVHIIITLRILSLWVMMEEAFLTAVTW